MLFANTCHAFQELLQHGDPESRCLRKTHAAQPFSFAQAVSFAGYVERRLTDIDRMIRMEGDIPGPSSSFSILVLHPFTDRYVSSIYHIRL